MRFTRLHLDKYGHLTDVALDLPTRAPDLYLVLGANEAGKTTTQDAIADFLFGFGHKTAHDHRHAAADLRVGARLEAGGAPLEVWRKKGRVNTLLDARGAPVDEAPLGALLAGVDGETFRRQFSLSHERLREGGQAILEADNDLGRMLFQAGAGLDWLGAQLTVLETEADRLFRPRGQTQAVAVALKRRTEALRRQRAAAVSERAYDEAQRAVAEVEAALAAANARHRAMGQRLARLGRARWAIPILRRLDGLRRTRADLGETPDLPAAIVAEVDAAAAAVETADAATRAAREEHDRAQRERDGITVDRAVLARADEIRTLLDVPRERFRAAEADLPRQEAQRQAAVDRIAALAREIGRPTLTVETLGAHLPSRDRRASLRDLAGRHEALAQAAARARAESTEARRALEDARNTLAALAPVPDAAPLVEALDAVRADSGLGERLTQARDQVTTLRREIDGARAALAPPAPEGVARAALPMTAAAELAAESLAAQDAALRDLRRDLASLDGKRTDVARTRRDLLERGGAVPEARLIAAREARDQGWAALRREFEAGAVPPAADLDAHAARVAEADRVADERFQAAETSGQLAALDGQRADLEAEHKGLTERIATAERARAETLAAWGAAWAGTGIDPGPPEMMADWLRHLEIIEARHADLRQAEAALETHGADETRHRRALGAVLAGLGTPGDPTTEPLPDQTRRAGRLKDDLDARARTRGLAEDALRRANADDAKARDAHTAASEALHGWETDWAAALAAWSLPADTRPAAVDAVLDAWDDLARAHDQLTGETGLLESLKAMTADHAAFLAGLADLLAAVAPDLAADQEALPPLRAAQALEARLTHAGTQGALWETAAEQAETRAKALEHARAAEARARAGLAALLTRLAVDTLQAARPVLERLTQLAALDEAEGEALRALAEADDGLGEPALRADAEALGPGLDRDAIIADEKLALEEAERIGTERETLSATLARHKANLEGFDQAGAAAAEAAEDVEQAAAEALRAAERYVRLRTTADLLRHAVERYRAENEAPLLRRAGALFDTLTLGRYDGLLVDREDPEAPRLRARPADGGATVPMDGLSDGARDQLYLALRLAGLEALLDRGTRLPFIADDVFVHFDDARAAAGLGVLADLAERTQVLVFTHHHHLVSLAEATIPGRFGPLALGA